LNIVTNSIDDMVKTLTIRDDVYQRLAAIKGKDESFSELFERLAGHRGSLELLMRIRGSIEFESAAEKGSFVRQRRREKKGGFSRTQHRVLNYILPKSSKKWW
jgi:predicted CopG family antitoxin